ncbi:unnamed protein product, partial [Discosporangium mesarthrocarpum]
AAAAHRAAALTSERLRERHGDYRFPPPPLPTSNKAPSVMPMGPPHGPAWAGSSSSGRGSTIASAAEKEMGLERDTWSLLLELSRVQEESKNISDEREERMVAVAAMTATGRGGGGMAVMDGAPGVDATDGEVIDALRREDREFRRAEVVVAWLEAVA